MVLQTSLSGWTTAITALTPGKYAIMFLKNLSSFRVLLAYNSGKIENDEITYHAID
jgi:hypothetical protein